MLLPHACVALILTVPNSNQDDDIKLTSHERMLITLEQIRIKCEGDNLYLGWGPVEAARERLSLLPKDRQNRDRHRALVVLGRELLRMGETEAAIEAYLEAVQGLEVLPQDTKVDRTELGEVRL
ncbi:MAG: hypothetical protein O2816_09365 [Planctomycetota bacterium]|nr:hypothetical protein [Planctomycetota bacterium]